MKVNKKLDTALKTKKFKKVDAVIVEDSDLIRDMYADFAKQKGRKVDIYESRVEFLEKLDEYAKDTIIIVNYGFNKTPNGIAASEVLFKKGYANYYMTTSFTREQFQMEEELIPLYLRFRVIYKFQDMEKIWQLILGHKVV